MTVSAKTNAKRARRSERKSNRVNENGTGLKNQNFDLKIIKPLTQNQNKVFQYFNKNNLFIHGVAGTGKSFISLYLALKELENPNTPYQKVVIIRSNVGSGSPMGFLPGNAKEKTKVYELPYEQICSELFGRGDAYTILKQKGIIEFEPTTFLRGTTFTNAIIIVDEVQNLQWMESSTVITRVGDNTKIIFCGDIRQTDLRFEDEKTGRNKFFGIIRKLPSFKTVEFEIEDIVRSGVCKEFIIECVNQNIM